MSNKLPQQGLFGPLSEEKTPAVTVAQEATTLVSVALESGGDSLFDYGMDSELAGHLSPGQRVRVPFGKGNRMETAFCVGFPEKSLFPQVKIIHEVIDPKPLLDEKMLQLAQWMSQYYCCPLGAVLCAMVPAAVKRRVGMVRRSYVNLTSRAGDYLANTGDSVEVRVSTQGKAILDFLGGTAGKKIALDNLLQEIHCTKAPLRTLERAGLIEITQQQEMARLIEKAEGATEHSFGVGPAFELNARQQEALAGINKLIEQGGFNAVLLHGVTGSGKTEVYIRAIEKVLSQGRQAIVLVPEIALTPQMHNQFLSRFEHVAILHSAMNNRRRHQQWRQIADGHAKVVIGPRSAVFAPLPNLGLIIVDEEHESSYKQDATPRYHGRDVAIKRAQMAGITIVLGSATPSLETLVNCQSKKHYHKISLPDRVMNLSLPKVTTVDMRSENLERKGRHLLSRLLEEQIEKTLREKHQAILLLNRRGHSSYLYCPSCQFTVTCPNCDVTLTYHKRKLEFSSVNFLICHHCQHSCRVPGACPVCGKKLVMLGPGTQRAEEEIVAKFPQACLQRIDSDSMKAASYEEVLRDFATGKIDVLMGTQMIGKGLDFPNVTLVGVINADTALAIPDFRSSERTFQLIAQVAGRCGRGCDNGRVIVQSYLPDEPALQMACKHDYQEFARHELLIRQQCQMPPYGRLARLLIRDTKLEKAEAAARMLRQYIDSIIAQGDMKIQLRGPMPAGIARIENQHRQEILLKAAGAEPIQKLLSILRREYLTKINVQIIVDVDPINLM